MALLKNLLIIYNNEQPNSEVFKTLHSIVHPFSNKSKTNTNRVFFV